MEIISVDTTVDSAIQGSYIVKFSVSPEEAEELRNALDVVSRYEGAACQAVLPSGDFTEYYCSVISDTAVTVEVNTGSIG